MIRHPEYQYLDLLKSLLDDGDERIDRTQVGTKALFGRTMRFDLADGFPVFTTKRLYWKTAFKEMLWMLSGGTNIRELLLQNVRIWTDWPLKHYRISTGENISQLDFEQRIVNDPAFAAQWGELGPVYGKQWRRWQDAAGNEIDQIQILLDGLQNNPTSRRLLFEGWNVAELDSMALPPCHKTYQAFYSPNTNKLSFALYARSQDFLIGTPFNICNLAFLAHLFAHHLGYEPGEVIWFGADVHLYSNHQEQAMQQIAREPKPFPRLVIKRKAASFFDYNIDDFELEGYEPHAAIAAEIAV